ncbi:hypothetical protein QL285_049317 [Trifolium repens]|nr:hypothetical protein QL285_049317 [Trifolium repens]
MSLSHLLKSANCLGLLILQNHQGRISSPASYRAMHHRIIGNKGSSPSSSPPPPSSSSSSSSSWLPRLLRGGPQQSCSDVALFKQSITMIVLPLVASSMVLMHLNTLTYNHEVLIPYLDKVFDPHIDGKPVYSADEVREARSSFPY